MRCEGDVRGALIHRGAGTGDRSGKGDKEVDAERGKVGEKSCRQKQRSRGVSSLYRLTVSLNNQGEFGAKTMLIII